MGVRSGISNAEANATRRRAMVCMASSTTFMTTRMWVRDLDRDRCVASFFVNSARSSDTFHPIAAWRFMMLPPFIIEQIRRREEQERARHERPHLEIPTDRPAPRAPQSPDESGDRGVIVIDLMGED
jgi:hypothetical protein